MPGAAQPLGRVRPNQKSCGGLIGAGRGEKAGRRIDKARDKEVACGVQKHRGSCIVDAGQLDGEHEIAGGAHSGDDGVA